MHQMLSEIHIIGARTRERIVLREACPALWQHRITMCGLTEARAPYRMERPQVGFSEMVVGLEGTGRVLVDGAWRELAAGEAYLATAGHDQRFCAIPGRFWSFGWVHLQPTGAMACIPPTAPCVVRADGGPLAQAIAGLHREVLGPNDPAVTANLAALVAIYARRIGGGVVSDERLWRVWRLVDAEPERAWSLPALADIACMSPEHLRRQCRRELGKSPMAHVTDLRMQRAAILLRLASFKMETIAAKVGYGSLYAFSAAFKRWAGVSPSAYRTEARAGEKPS
jgi:AraC-like DNA-binding protein